VSGVRVAPPVQISDTTMKIITYFKEAYAELIYKVTWPSWEELQGSAIVVMIASFLIAIVVALMDLIFKNMMSGVYGLFY
jgi:preprotein translocase subunit SecE